MQTIKFSTNWNNKLNCTAFTTLRPANPGKYAVGDKYEIECPKKIASFTAEIMAITIVKLDTLNPFISYLDTGYSVDEVKEILHKMYKGKVEKFYLILLKKVN